MLLSHLSESKALQVSWTGTPRTHARTLVKRAHRAMSTLGQFGPFLGPTDKANLLCINRGWTGILRWMSFFYEKYKELPVRADCMEKCQDSLHMVAYVLYAITQDMNTIHPPHLPVPVCTAAFCHVLETASPSMLDEAISTAGGAGSIAETILRHLRGALKSSTLNPKYIEIYIRLLSTLAADHKETSAMRHALMEKSCIRFLIRALLCLSMVGPAGGRHHHPCDAVTDLHLAFREGILQVLANLCPSLHRLHAMPLGVMTALVGKMVPKYLVYHSVLLAVQSGLLRMTQEDHEKVAASPMRDSWDFMERLVAEHLDIDRMTREGTGQPTDVFVNCDYCAVHALKSTFKTYS
ncbi:hypothetical protein EVG20_g10322 [Dentipellis fragilis]|uniref:Uncharacterized protein n=1 Tax=Dentipellis fragilis TaxID=205917 RepID=A0A4Y9XS93_9AGAM|nr:hypothetical protein EVG20_g10322 [Dentipellis fragilis]